MPNLFTVINNLLENSKLIPTKQRRLEIKNLYEEKKTETSPNKGFLRWVTRVACGEFIKVVFLTK